jgi:hypothetical protein
MVDYFQDTQRHLVCKPYSRENLHDMARFLGIKRCWFHAKPYPHYDIPKRRFPLPQLSVKIIMPKDLLLICKEGSRNG